MIRIVFARTLYSQSAASLTVNNITAVLRAEKIFVDLCLVEKNNHQNARKILENIHMFPVILLKINFQDYGELLPLCVEIRKRNIIKCLLLVGPFAALNAEGIMNAYYEIDGIFYGDAEYSVLSFMKSLKLNEKPVEWDCGVEGAIWRHFSTRKIINNINKTKSFNLDELPLPARDIEVVETASLVNLESSRGCFYNCSFCHIPALEQYNHSRVMFKSIDNIVQEIKYLRYKLNKRFFIFNDCIFWYHNDQRIIKFANKLLEEKIDIWFMIYLRCQPFMDKKILKLLARAGLIRIFLGIENISEQVLKTFQKPNNAKEFIKIRKILNELLISYHIGYIVFHPYTSLEEVVASIDYLFKINKMFRVGIITEKVRLIPHSSLKKKCSELILSSNKQIDAAYEYAFRDKDVDLVYNAIIAFFDNKLDFKYRNAEFYCTSLDLAIHLALRFDHDFKKKFAKEFEAFFNVKDDYQKFIYRVLKYIIAVVKESKINITELNALIDKQNFYVLFWDYYYKLQINWGILLEKIKLVLGHNIVNSLFTGDERI